VRRWTRLGTVAIAAHAFYELASGVAMPFSSFVGPAPASALWATGSMWLSRTAGRRPHSDDGFFAVVNGVYLSAVIAHFVYWPTRWRAGMPLLTECEGLKGRAITPYNAILYVSAITALGGMYENRNAAKRGVVVPILLVPMLILVQNAEFKRLRTQALRRPAWWNRRLRPVAAEPGSRPARN
jgi:hypothetical protein